MARSLSKCIDDLNARDYVSIAKRIQAVNLVMESLCAIARTHFPSVPDGGVDQSQIVLGLLPLVADTEEEEDEPELPPTALDLDGGPDGRNSEPGYVPPLRGPGDR